LSREVAEGQVAADYNVVGERSSERYSNRFSVAGSA
jgi:hypothetical protein